jgi:hypothetical protein
MQSFSSPAPTGQQSQPSTTPSSDAYTRWQSALSRTASDNSPAAQLELAAAFMHFQAAIAGAVRR